MNKITTTLLTKLIKKILKKTYFNLPLLLNFFKSTINMLSLKIHFVNQCNHTFWVFCRKHVLLK